MKTLKSIITFMLFIIFLPLSAGASSLGELRLSLVEGDVQVRAEDTDEWFPAAVNMPIREGDRLWVPDGTRTEIQARNGTAIRVDEKSSLDILTVDAESLQLYLGMGQAYLNFRGKRDSFIQLDTPVSSVRVYESTKLNVAVSRYGETDISVYRGRVYAESRNGKTQISEGRMLSLADDYADLAPLRRPDEWEEWNRSRDREFEERGYSVQYLPAELEGYASDFDHNGRWLYTTSYGYVWTPTVHVSLGWAPYRHGRWVWIGGDYVWIAFEPWGWAPYHYGRWTHLTSFGWCWVPPDRGDVYWGPGYVGWVYTPTYVSWVPLAPREIYYGYGHYGRHSHNIVNVNINTVVVKNVYKNVSFHNAVTVVPHEAFLKGKREEFSVRENPFLKERISVGRPAIGPERSTRMPVIRDVPRAKEPPAQVREIKVSAVRAKRSFVRERERSVFQPETRQKSMPVRTVRESKSWDAARGQEPVRLPGKQQSQPASSGKPEKSSPGKGRETYHVPAENKTGPSGGPADKKPSAEKPYPQGQKPLKEQERQIRQDKEKTGAKPKGLRGPEMGGNEIQETPVNQKTGQSGALRSKPGIRNTSNLLEQATLNDQNMQVPWQQARANIQPEDVKKQGAESRSPQGNAPGIPSELLKKKMVPQSQAAAQPQGKGGVQQDNAPGGWRGREGGGKK